MDRIAYDEGVFIRGTPLWVDPRKRRELAVLTRPSATRPAAHRRVVVPSFLAEHLAPRARFATVLPTPVGRWVGVAGGLLQFLPLDNPWHVAALIHLDGHRFLITPDTTFASVPECDEVVVTEVRSKGPRFTVEALVARVEAFADAAAGPITVRVASPEVACALCSGLRSVDRRVSTRGWLSNLLGPGPRRSDITAVIATASAGAERPTVVLGPPGSNFGPAELHVDVTIGADAREIRRLAEAAGAESVTVVGGEGRDTEVPTDLRWHRLAVAQQLALG